MYNKRKELKERIEKALATKSTVLDLSSLNLTELPDGISELTFLTHLDLSYNNFNRIPYIIHKLTSLQYLDLKYNSLTYVNGLGFEFSNYLPINFLDLSYNLLSKIPQDIYYLDYLDEIRLTGNEVLNGIPIHIVNAGLGAIDGYYDGLYYSDSTDSVFEAKVIFVGQGEVGKTSLMKKLIDPNFEVIEGVEKSTHGINIENWLIDIPFYNEEVYNLMVNDYGYYHEEYEELAFKNGFEFDEESDHFVRTVKLNIWDFGGQDIYYSTHQFFLTKRSIYIFVWDARKEEEYKSFEYWFNTINMLSEASPIIIVMNKAEQRIRQIEEANLLKEFPNIQNFIKVSCITGEGLEQLRYEIINVFKGLPHLGDRLPKAWLNLRNSLNNLNDNFISFKEYSELCHENLIPTGNINLISDYSHDLGDILYFKNDPILKNIIIINPEWVTNACYKLIDDIIIQNNYGKFSFSDLERAWHSSIYPKDKHFEIVRLMEKFEICFNLIGTYNYIIPELLKPDMVYENFNIINNSKLKFEYEFKFMPAGIITRFICRNFYSIEKDLYWKNGVVLKFDDSTGLIIGDRLNRKIKIFITGEDCEALLGIIRKDFENILTTLNLNKDKEYIELIPCNCKICLNNTAPYFFNFSVLKLFRNKKKETIDCHKSAETVMISSLIKGYEKIRPGDRVLEHLIVVCSQLQGQNKIYDSKEDSRNGIITTALNNRGFISKDQTRWGQSPSKKSQGEIDIKIENKFGLPISIFEGINLSYIDTGKIHSHIEKIFGYDSNGLDDNFFVLYVESSKFIEMWDKYKSVVLTANTRYKTEGEFVDLSDIYSYGSHFKIGRTFYRINDRLNSIYHLFLDMTI